MSGEPPVEPVVSRKSGHMFEKRTVLAYLTETGTCPISGQPLTAEDLIELKGIFVTWVSLAAASWALSGVCCFATRAAEIPLHARGSGLWGSISPESLCCMWAH